MIHILMGGGGVCLSCYRVFTDEKKDHPALPVITETRLHFAPPPPVTDKLAKSLYTVRRLALVRPGGLREAELVRGFRPRASSCKD